MARRTPNPPGVVARRGVSPRDADEMFRDCWRETAAALRSARVGAGLDSDLEEAAEDQANLNANGMGF